MELGETEYSSNYDLDLFWFAFAVLLQAHNVQTMKLIWRPQDLVLVLLLLAAMAFTLLRGLVINTTDSLKNNCLPFKLRGFNPEQRFMHTV